MPYKFKFDLSRVSQTFFRGIAKDVREKEIHKRAGRNVRRLVERLKVRELTGLNVSDAATLVEDFVDVYARNLLEREEFRKTKKRTLLLPHCARKYMDGRCQAWFDSTVPSYYCAHCSSDCLINRASTLGEEKGYDVHVLPGGSCIPEILKKRSYDGVVGVACTQELKEGGEYLKRKKVPGQVVFLVKNGCANTRFNIESLESVL